MDNEEKLFCKSLEDRPYRLLQQMAKSLGLPCNFKKIYLIELILAQKYKSECEVKAIVNRVKLERLQTSKAKRDNKRRKMQTSKAISITKSFSPPITTTPKRPSQVYDRSSPEFRSTLMKRNLMQNINQNTQTTSDRTLRSFLRNLKSTKPNYALMNSQGVKSHEKETKFKIITNEGSFPQFNVTAKCVVKKHRPNVISHAKTALKTPMMLTQSMDLLQNPIAAKRLRLISGIYPLIPPETIHRNLQTSQSVCLRKIDGSLTKINALVQKRIDIIPSQKNNYKNCEINIQDIINSIDTNVDHMVTENNLNNNYLQINYPNLSSFDTVSNTNAAPQLALDNNKDSETDVYSVYYHKKIRAEQIRCQRLKELQNNEILPKISEAFTKFNNVYRSDLTQPLFVQVSTESERSQNHPVYIDRGPAKAITLEHLYNFKSQLLPNIPLLQIATTSNTRCVYSAPTVVTAVAQPSAIVSNEVLNVSSFEMDNLRNQYDVDPRWLEFPQFSDQNAMRRNFEHNEDYNTSTLSLETSQDMSTSIPEMVEDALEIISQDGDYMERIAKDVKVQCVLCDWTGPNIILEYHIRKEHTDSIHNQCKSEWNITYTLGGLVGARLWRSEVIEHDHELYVLSAKYEDPDCFMASLSLLSMDITEKLGSITIYNKVSGEPYTWNGQIQSLPPNLPHENDAGCLKIELSRLNLLPNSANLKLVNGELVTDSPSKVVVGQPMLDDIHLILFVRIYD